MYDEHWWGVTAEYIEVCLLCDEVRFLGTTDKCPGKEVKCSKCERPVSPNAPKKGLCRKHWTLMMKGVAPAEVKRREGGGNS